MKKRHNKNTNLIHLVKNTIKASFTSFAVLTLASVGQAQVPEIITYEGFVTSEGTNFNGEGYFKFALIDNTPETYWSNDGTSFDGLEPVTSVPIDVIEGSFMLGLGDANLDNMEPIPADVFSNPDIYLRIWFDDGVNGFSLLTPDEQMTSVGYAMVAAQMPEDAIDGSAIAPDSIETEHLGVQSVTETALADGSVTTAKLADNAVTEAKIAENAISADQIVDGTVSTDELANGSVTNMKLADDAVTTEKVAPNSIHSKQIVNNTVSSADVADSLTLETLELGGMHWDGSLRLFSQPVGGGLAISGGTPRGYLEANQSGSELSLLLPNGTEGAEVWTHNPGGRIRLWDMYSTLTTDMGPDQGGGYLHVYQSKGKDGVRLEGTVGNLANGGVAGAEITVHNRAGEIGVRVDGDDKAAGRIEVFPSRVNSKEHTEIATVDLLGSGEESTGGEIYVRREDGKDMVVVDADSGTSHSGRITLLGGQGNTGAILYGGTSSGSGALSLRNSDGARRAVVETDKLGGKVTLWQDDGDAGAVLYGHVSESNPAGALSLRKANGNVGMRLYGGPDAGELEVYSAGGEVNVECWSTSDEDGVVTVRNSEGDDRVRLWAALNKADGSPYDGGSFELLEGPDGSNLATVLVLADEGGEVWLKQADGSSTVQLHADYDGSGEGRVITEVLEITGGSDLSEQFEIETIDRQPEPGMLVCIDTDQPGQLALSTKAYDRTAAGIISGAGGVKPGMLMGQAGSIADGKYPVALTGRVYCNVDADYGSIQPGDLITTSDTPGLGMKVTDHARAQGAIIGKAMTRLESGQGQVLVLVSLQ